MKGYTPDTVVFDLPTEFNTSCGPDGKPLSANYDPEKCYSPQNYDAKYRGPVTLRSALAQSLNVPAVKTLYLTGLKDSLRTAKDLGITTLTNPDQYGLTLVLGGGEVSLLELSGAYATFANDGVRNQTTPILLIEDAGGVVLEKFAEKSVRVIPEAVARTINDVLSDESARAPSFGYGSALFISGRQVAAKTGTTNDYRDAWILGYTPSIVIGAWAGNNNNTAMEKKVAGFIIAPLWNALMKKVLANTPSERFPAAPPVSTELKPILRGIWQGNTVYEVDTISGKLATEYTPLETREERVIPDVHSILHWINKNDPLGEPPTNPENDSQYTSWEYAVKEWLLTNPVPNYSKPIESDDIHVPGKFPTVSVISPKSDAVVSRSIPLSIVLQTTGVYPRVKAEYYLNGQYLGSSLSPFIFSFTPNDLEFLEADAELKVVVYDSVYNKVEVAVPLHFGN